MKINISDGRNNYTCQQTLDIDSISISSHGNDIRVHIINNEGARSVKMGRLFMGNDEIMAVLRMAKGIIHTDKRSNDVLESKVLAAEERLKEITETLKSLEQKLLLLAVTPQLYKDI